MKRIFLFAYSVFCCFNLMAQEPDFKFGIVPKEDLAMTTYSQDTTADAVVLESYGFIQVIPGDEHPLNQTFYRRIKVLKQSAIEREGDLAIGFYSKNGGEFIKSLSVYIHNEGEKIESVTMNDAFVDKRNEFVSVMKLSLPNVKVGSVIDIKYEHNSRFFTNIDKWYFQEGLPIRHSVLDADFSKDFNYVYLLNKDASLVLTSTDGGVQLYKDGITELKIKDTHFEMANMPAMKQGEPYVTSYDDYLCTIKFQLSQYVSQGFLQDHMSTWDLLADNMMESNYFGGQYNRRSKYSKLLKAAGPLVFAEKDKKEKLIELYDFVNDAIKNVGRTTSYIKVDKLDEAFLASQANSAEMNLMLHALLREANIKSRLLFVSTRNNGRPIPSFPIRDQFDFFMLYVTIGEDNYMVDAGNPLRPIGYPRTQALNGKGWLASKKSNEWIDIKAQKV